MASMYVCGTSKITNSSYWRTNVESDSGNGGDDLTELELVEHGGLTSGIEADHENTHLFLAEALEHLLYGPNEVRRDVNAGELGKEVRILSETGNDAWRERQRRSQTAPKGRLEGFLATSLNAASYCSSASMLEAAYLRKKVSHFVCVYRIRFREDEGRIRSQRRNDLEAASSPAQPWFFEARSKRARNPVWISLFTNAHRKIELYFVVAISWVL